VRAKNLQEDDKGTSWVKEVMIKFVKLSKIPKVVRFKFFKRTKYILRIEEINVKSCETASVFGGKAEQQGG